MALKSERPHRIDVASNVRNFCIIAHIDHGKTTLSDRLLEITRTVAVARSRGAGARRDGPRARTRHHDPHASGDARAIAPANGELYRLNLIDTPGHVDFSYEVSRSLAACEGAVLIIDAAQGIEAQTLANYHLALEHELTIIPVINKIDLPAADPERVMGEIEELLVMEKSECILASAKNGIGIEEILEAIVQRIPPPKGHRDHLRGARLQRAVRSVSRRRQLRARRRRQAVAGNALHVDGARARLRMHRGRHLRAADARDGVARSSATSAT